jgi:hypothetical protein
MRNTDDVSVPESGRTSTQDAMKRVGPPWAASHVVYRIRHRWNGTLAELDAFVEEHFPATRSAPLSGETSYTIATNEGLDHIATSLYVGAGIDHARIEVLSGPDAGAVYEGRIDPDDEVRELPVAERTTAELNDLRHALRGFSDGILASRQAAGRATLPPSALANVESLRERIEELDAEIERRGSSTSGVIN